MRCPRTAWTLRTDSDVDNRKRGDDETDKYEKVVKIDIFPPRGGSGYQKGVSGLSKRGVSEHQKGGEEKGMSLDPFRTLFVLRKKKKKKWIKNPDESELGVGV